MTVGCKSNVMVLDDSVPITGEEAIGGVRFLAGFVVVAATPVDRTPAQDAI